MKKKVVATMLTLCMAMGLFAGCGAKKSVSTDTTEVSNEYEEKVINGITYHVATDLTKEDITLTYMHFDQDETVQYLAERFMELYPNIKVNVVYENVGTYQDTLLALAAEGKDMPDVIMYSDADFALSNQLLTDITSFYDSDEETKKVASTINDCNIGCFGTDVRYAVPVKFFPGALYVDRNVLKKLNIEIPGQDWTWDEMIQLIKDSTTDIGDGISYYGLGFYNRLDSLYGIAAAQTIQGEFGFDGKNFDLSAWAVGEQQFSDLKLSGVVAPSQNSDAMEAWYGDFEAWCGSTGHVALFTEAFWTFQNLWNTEAYKEYNLDIVPYVIPAVSEADASAEHHSIATIDFGGITESCTCKREAYELLKFMSFGRDGWLTRIEAYNDESIVNASGVALKHDVMPVPITTDEEVWNAYIDMYCAGMDEEHVEAWRNYFASCMQPIPFGWTSIPGYFTFCDKYFNSIGIHNLVDTGAAKAADYVDEATERANYYHAEAMISYFGPSGYDVLSDDDIAYWQSIVDNNGIVE